MVAGVVDRTPFEFQNIVGLYFRNFDGGGGFDIAGLLFSFEYVTMRKDQSSWLPVSV